MKNTAKRQKDDFVKMFRYMYDVKDGRFDDTDIRFICACFDNYDHDTKKEIVKYMITEKMTGKMEGFSALSTSAAINPNCAKLAKIRIVFVQSVTHRRQSQDITIWL